MQINNIEVIAQNNLEKALQVIEKSGVRQAWGSIGATVNQVGSLAMGLLMKHRDIDFHIYTDKLDIAESFKAVQKICANPAVTRMEYRNLADTAEACLEFHLWFMLDNEEWQIDMIQILRGSQFDGYFENVAERIKAVLTPEIRRTILELKYLTPDNGRGLKLSSLASHSKTAMLVENYGHLCYGNDAINSAKTHISGNMGPNRAPYFRHNQRTAVIFADGHVESRSKEQIPSQEGYPDINTDTLKNTLFNMGKVDNSKDTLAGF
jgi:prepilin-type processing-associated H-X9-DG protein